MSTYNEMKKKAESDQDRIELRSPQHDRRDAFFFDPVGEYDLGDHIRSAGLDRLACIFTPLSCVVRPYS